jgi:predicted DNA-binding transcriptional regulator AlpA
MNRFLSEQEVEREYGFAKATTLRRWRLYGNKGPRWRKLQGAIRYDRADIEAWIAACPAGGVKPGGAA